MRRPYLVIIVLAMLAGCDSKSPVVPTPTPTPAPSPPPAPEVTGVTVTGDSKFATVNEVRQFTASARMQDGSVRDVTSEATWSSSNTDVVNVSNAGAVTSVGAGLATVFATFTLNGSIDVSVASESTSRLSGLYRLAVTAAPECSALPDWAQHREYDASIAGAETSLTLTAQLEPGAAPQFDGAIGGSRVSVVFPPASGGGGGCYYYYYCGRTSVANGLLPAFAHMVDSARLYTLWGQATGTKGASHDVRISGTVNGVITAVNASTNETLAECTSVSHRFTLTRQ